MSARPSSSADAIHAAIERIGWAHEAARIRGCFCLSILHEGRLAGRFDPKLDRKADVLLLKAIYLEPGVDPCEKLVAGIGSAMRDVLALHDAAGLDAAGKTIVAASSKFLNSVPLS